MSNMEIPEGSFTKINVLGRGDCLFWAVTLAYLTPVRDNNDLFQERFERLFGSNNQQEVLSIQGVIRNHDLFLSDFDVEDSPLFKNEILTKLVTEEFRRKVVYEMHLLQNEFIEHISIQDLLHSRNIDYVVKGRFQENFLSKFGAEINQYNINLNKLKPDIFDEAAANTIDDELDKIPDQDKVKKFKFDAYLECMRNPGAWGGNHEIQAISEFLQCEIVTFFNHVRHSTGIGNYNGQIQLFNEGELHYNFGLVKGEVLINAINNNEWNKVKGYLALGIDNINYQDNEERTAFDLIQHGDDAEIDQLLSNQGAKPASELIGVDTSGSRAVDAVNRKDIDGTGAPQDFELIELLIREMGPVVGSDASTPTQRKEDFESFQARFQSYIDQISSYLHSVGKPGFFSHFFMGSFSTLLDTEIAEKLNIKKIYFSFDTSLTLKVVVVKNGPIGSAQDAINNIDLFSISEGKRGHQFTSGELEKILRENIDKSKIKDLEKEIQKDIKSKLVKISKGKDGISVTMETKEVVDHPTATRHEFSEMEKGLWNNPEGDIARLTSPDKTIVENYLKEILGKISEIHSTYENKNSLRYSQRAREAAHHGFVAGVLNNFRYRYNLRVYLEQFAGRGYADIVLLARGYDRSLKSIPIIIEQKAATSEELRELKKLKDSADKKKKKEKIEENSRTTPAAALEQAANYAKGFQPNVQRVLTTADDILCVGINFDYPSSISNIRSLNRDLEVVPLFEDILQSIDKWSIEESIGKRGLKKQIKVNVERIYHTFPGTTEKGGNHYFSRFLLGQLLLLDEPLGASYKKYIFIYKDNIPTETRPRPLRSSQRLADRIIPTNLDESHAVVSIVLIPEDTEKLVCVINTVEINRKREIGNDVLNQVLPLNKLDREIGDRKIVEFDLDFDTRYKSNFKRYLTARAHKPASLEEYSRRNEAFQGTFSKLLYPTELKETFDKALDSQRTPSSIDEYHELFKKIGEGIWPFRGLIGNEAHFQGVLNGVFSYYSDLKLQESPETRALVLTEFQTGGGKRIDMLVHGVKFEDGGENAKEYAPIGLELKASRQGKGGSAKALLEEANTQINDEYKKGVTYKTLTDGDEVKFIGVVFDKAAKDGNSLVLLSKSKIDGFIPIKVVHSSTLVLPTVDKQDLSGCLGQGNRKKRSTSRCLFSWDDIDKFNNVENVDKRNKGKIKIDNEKFLTYIKNSQDESKNAQLVDFIGEKITPSIEGNYKYLLNEVVQDGGYVNYDQNKRINDLRNDVLQEDGGLVKNSKLKSRLMNAAGRIQLIRGIHGAIVSCKDGTATDCGLNLGGIAWSFASQPIENVLVKITPTLVRQAESVAGRVISGTLGKQTKFAIRVLGVKFGTPIARGTAGALAGVFDIVDIGISASNLVDCKNRENTDNPCEEKEIRDNIASISFSSVSFVSGIGLTAASMPMVGVAVGLAIMVIQGSYSGVSNIIEYEKKYDTTHSENWSIFWRTLFLKAMSLDIQALEARHNIVNSIAQQAWQTLNNSSDSVVAYAVGFGDMLKEVSVRCTLGTGGSCPCGNNQFGVGFYKKCDEIRIVDEAGHAVIAMNEENYANTENLSRFLPNAIQNAEMICLPQATSEVYEKGIKKSDPTAVYRCENAMVIADKRKGMQNDKTIVYNLRHVNSGTIIGSNRLNNNFLIFKGNELVIGGNSTVNRFVFTNSDFSGKIVLGSNSTNVLDLSTVTEDIIRVNINYSHFSDISNIFYSGELQIKINDNEYLRSNINTSSSYHYIGRQNKIDQILCTGNSESLIGHNIIVNSGGGIDLREKDLIENCGKVIISPNTNIKGEEGNYTFYIETNKGYKDRKLHSEIDVEGKGTVIFPEINLFSDCDEVTYSSDDNILSLKIKLGQDSQYILDIKNYIAQGNNGKPNFILIDKNGSNIVPKIENFGSSTVVKVNSFELHAEYPLDNFDVVENRYREILNNNKDYKVFGVVRDKVKNQGNSTVPHMMFGSSGNDIINLDQGAVFAKGGNGSDIYVIDSCVGEREFIIDNDSDDKKLDILVLPEVPEGFSIQQGNLHLNCDDTRIQVKNYEHLMVMNNKGETFIPYVQSIFDDSFVGNGELVPFIYPTPTQDEFFLHKGFEYDHLVIDSRSEDIERYRDKDDLLLMREIEVPFIIKVEGYYDGSSRWENVNFLLWNNGNFSYFDLPQEIDEVISYQDKLKDDYEEIVKEYIIDFNRSVDIKHNQNDSLASVDQDKERIGVIILKGVHPDRVKVSSSGSDLVLRDIESNDTVNIKNWDSSESHRISTLEFDLGLDPLVIHRLNRFSLSNVVEIQTLINKASENYQNKAAVTENENDFKCFVSVNAFETKRAVYECLGFSQLQDQINFTENFCSLGQINQFKDKIPGPNKILQLLRSVQNGFSLKGYEQNSKCSDLIFAETVRLLVNKKDELDYTQLHYASAQMDNLGLEFLINNGANINAISIFGETPLHVAAIGGKLKVVKFLVGKGANINIVNNHGRTPLEEANRLGNSGTRIADFLMRKQNEYNLSLFDAVKDGDYDKVKGLLNKGANIEAKDNSRGRTPLDLAVEFDRPEILKLLINKAIEQNKLNLVKLFLLSSTAETSYINLSRRNWTLLHYAAYNGNLAIFQAIFELPVEKRGNINHVEAYAGWTPLHVAVYCNRIDVARFLLDNGANIEAKDSGLTPLDLAGEPNRPEILKLLINKAVEQNKLDLVKLFLLSSATETRYINPSNRRSWTLLHYAAYNGNLAIFQVIFELPVEKRGNINHVEAYAKWTPLHVAVYYNRSDVARFLVDQGAGIKAKDSRGLTPLDLAGEPNRPEILKLLINKAVEQNELDFVNFFLLSNATETRYIEPSNRWSWILLHYAAYNGNLAIFQVIFELPVEKRGNINHVEAYANWTPLHIAVYCNRIDVTRFLLDNGADVEAKDKNGDTPLHITARYNNNLLLADLLLKNGANIKARNKEGYVPLRLAIRLGNSEIADFLFLSAKLNEYNVSLNESARYTHHAISNQSVVEQPPHYAARISDSVSDFLRWPVSLTLGVGAGLVGLVGGYFGYRNRLRGRANLAPVAAAIPLLTLGSTANAKSTEFRTKRTEQRLSENSESIQTAAIGGTNPGQSVITQLQEITHYSPKAKVLPGTDKDRISHCLPGVQYGQEYIQGLTCHTENMRMMVFLKDSDIKLEKSEDSYSKQSCRSIEFNSRPSVYCEGDKTNIVYTPEIPQRPFEQLNEQLMLLQVVLHEGKKLYGWLQNLFSEKDSNAQIVKENSITTSVTDEQTTLWKEALDSTEKRLMDLTKVNTRETDLRWAWHILEDRKEEFEYLSQQPEVNSQEANVFAENLQALMSELEVIESLHSITSEHNESNTAPKTDKLNISSHKPFETSSLLFGKKNTVFNGNSGTTSWLKQGFFKAQSSVPTFISAPATNNSLSLSGKQSAI